MQAEILQLPLAQLVDSPSNPRKRMGDITELADSLRVQGVLQPICVRPQKRGAAPTWEIVYGHRRVRAARFAELETIPAIVRDLDDRQVLEAQLMENSQRADVHPLEEADALEALWEKHGATFGEISAHLGRPLSWVRARMRLCDLSPEGREAFLAGQLSTGVAVLVARLNDDQQQEFVEYAASFDDAAPITLREAKRVIEARFFLRLEDAPFDTADPTLVTNAGACGPCPYRSGSQLDLLGDVSTPDLCTRKSCFDRKKAATWERRAAAHRAAGGKVLEEEESEGVFYGWGQVRSDAGLVDADDTNHLGGWDDELERCRTWRETLPNAPVILARDSNGRIRELYERPPAIDEEDPAKVAARENERRQAIKRAREVQEEVLRMIRGTATELELPALLAFIINCAVERVLEYSHEPFQEISKALGIDLDEDLDADAALGHVREFLRTKSAAELTELALGIALDDAMVTESGGATGIFPPSVHELVASTPLNSIAALKEQAEAALPPKETPR